MALNDLNKGSHRRFNILTQEWVLVSPHRTKRPWQGQEEEQVQDQRESYEASCYLCPGNIRANGEKNPEYKSTFVFKNDFAAIQEDLECIDFEDGLLKAETETGICKVVCFSPDHSKSLADLSLLEIEQVIKVWQEEYETLGNLETINYVQIFENKGAIMGCSNPHPHGQIWAHRSIPNEIVKKSNSQQAYYKENQKSLLQQYLQQELDLKERIIYYNIHFTVLVPFWAVWPYEVMIIPNKHQQHIGKMSSIEQQSFAKALSVVTKAYDRLFKVSFPYSSGIHQAPTNSKLSDYWHWHMSFYPPLLRSATVKKFMVGYEMFATPQRDMTPELAANTIRDLIS